MIFISYKTYKRYKIIILHQQSDTNVLGDWNFKIYNIPIVLYNASYWTYRCDKRSHNLVITLIRYSKL